MPSPIPPPYRPEGSNAYFPKFGEFIKHSCIYLEQWESQGHLDRVNILKAYLNDPQFTDKELEEEHWTYFEDTIRELEDALSRVVDLEMRVRFENYSCLQALYPDMEQCRVYLNTAENLTGKSTKDRERFYLSALYERLHHLEAELTDIFKPYYTQACRRQAEVLLRTQATAAPQPAPVDDTDDEVEISEEQPVTTPAPAPAPVTVTPEAVDAALEKPIEEDNPLLYGLRQELRDQMASIHHNDNPDHPMYSLEARNAVRLIHNPEFEPYMRYVKEVKAACEDLLVMTLENILVYKPEKIDAIPEEILSHYPKLRGLTFEQVIAEYPELIPLFARYYFEHEYAEALSGTYMGWNNFNIYEKAMDLFMDLDDVNYTRRVDDFKKATETRKHKRSFVEPIGLRMMDKSIAERALKLLKKCSELDLHVALDENTPQELVEQLFEASSNTYLDIYNDLRRLIRYEPDKIKYLKHQHFKLRLEKLFDAQPTLVGKLRAGETFKYKLQTNEYTAGPTYNTASARPALRLGKTSFFEKTKARFKLSDLYHARFFPSSLFKSKKTQAKKASIYDYSPGLPELLNPVKAPSEINMLFAISAVYRDCAAHTTEKLSRNLKEAEGTIFLRHNHHFHYTTVANLYTVAYDENENRLEEMGPTEFQKHLPLYNQFIRSHRLARAALTLKMTDKCLRMKRHRWNPFWRFKYGRGYGYTLDRLAEAISWFDSALKEAHLAAGQRFVALQPELPHEEHTEFLEDRVLINREMQVYEHCRLILAGKDPSYTYHSDFHFLYKDSKFFSGTKNRVMKREYIKLLKALTHKAVDIKYNRGINSPDYDNIEFDKLTPDEFKVVLDQAAETLLRVFSVYAHETYGDQEALALTDDRKMQVKHYLIENVYRPAGYYNGPPAPTVPDFNDPILETNEGFRNLTLTL